MEGLPQCDRVSGAVSVAVAVDPQFVMMKTLLCRDTIASWLSQELVRCHDQKTYDDRMRSLLRHAKNNSDIKAGLEFMLRNEKMAKYRSTLPEEDTEKEFKPFEVVSRAADHPLLKENTSDDSQEGEEEDDPLEDAEKNSVTRYIHVLKQKTKRGLVREWWQETRAFIRCHPRTEQVVYAHPIQTVYAVAYLLPENNLCLRVYKDGRDEPIYTRIFDDIHYAPVGVALNISASIAVIGTCKKVVAVYLDDPADSPVKTYFMMQPVLCVACSDTDEALVMVGTETGSAWLFDVETDAAVYNTCTPNITPVLSVRHAEERLVVQTAMEVIIFDISGTNAQIMQLGRTLALALSPTHIFVMLYSGMIHGYPLNLADKDDRYDIDIKRQFDCSRPLPWYQGMHYSRIERKLYAIYPDGTTANFQV